MKVLLMDPDPPPSPPFPVVEVVVIWGLTVVPPFSPPPLPMLQLQPSRGKQAIASTVTIKTLFRIFFIPQSSLSAHRPQTSKPISNRACMIAQAKTSLR